MVCLIEMHKFSQRGIIQLIPLLLLLAGIIAGVYLVQKTQIFKPKAGGGNVQWIISTGQDSQNCVTVKDGQYVITCPNAKFKILVPEEVNP